jgi:hypothetical protein
MSMLAATLLRYLAPAISLLTIPAAFGVFRVASRLAAARHTISLNNASSIRIRFHHRP